jgi:UDP-sulfoquinovose synthase
VFNQFTEQFSVIELAERVKAAGEHLGWDVKVAHIENPRKELEEHYYNAQHSKLIELGLQPRLLDEELIDTMLARIGEQRSRIDPATFVQNVRWAPEARARVGSSAEAHRR